MDRKIYPPINSWITLQSADKHWKQKLVLNAKPFTIVQNCYLENDIFVIFELDHHVSCLPVDIPGLHCGISPCLQMISFRKCHPHDPVGAYSKQFIFLLAMEPHHEQTDSVFRQRLPSTNEIHFWFEQIEILDVGVRLEDLLTQLARVPFPGEPWRHVILGCDLNRVGIYGRGGGGGLHAQERLDGVHLGVVSRVGESLALGRKPAGGEPLGVLILLKHKSELLFVIECSEIFLLTEINLRNISVIPSVDGTSNLTSNLLAVRLRAGVTSQPFKWTENRSSPFLRAESALLYARRLRFLHTK